VLAEHERADLRQLALAGADWLAAHQNADGGWGDTPDSVSNLSTTVLVWAALYALDAAPPARAALMRADEYLTRAAGGLDPACLARAVVRRYGDDRTFSAPILTMCALAGRLGADEFAWRHVAQLPFELAALPQSWFRYLQLPVVSYALPALIAIGHARHHHRPSRSPLARVLRSLTFRRTLSVLTRIQPPDGGFLEATPLTSFVLMSLVGSAQASHIVAARCAAFLTRSVRLDGSWPIDTNLATWVTTLSVNALSVVGTLHEHLGPGEQLALKNGLLGQQHCRRHAYTGAAPGGWAWTDLAGGVPDADDTAGALVALRHLGEPDAATIAAADLAVGWLLGLQNRDGGIPTFCRGWGRLPFDRSAPELTAHALVAWIVWRDRLPRATARRVTSAALRAAQYLRRAQRPDGAWVPLWFGNQAAPQEENPTYGTSRVLLALCRVLDGSVLPAAAGELAEAQRATVRGVSWLLRAQNADGGWGGGAAVRSTIEETGQALQALASVAHSRVVAMLDTAHHAELHTAWDRGTHWLVQATNVGQHFPTAPLGLYFARLWYSERLYPLIAPVGARASVLRARSERPG